MVLKDGTKMSKSKGNTVDPQQLIDKYGADTVRLFIMFASPPEQSLEWSDAGVEGASRFLRRLWNQIATHLDKPIPASAPHQLSPAEQTLRRQIHETIKKVSDDIGRRYTFNTAIAAMMELLNNLNRAKETSQNPFIIQEGLEAVVLMLSPIVPHITQALWEALGHSELIIDAPWPQLDESALTRDEIEMVVQVNGKLRTHITVPINTDKPTLENTVLNEPKVQRFIAGKTVKKIIIVPQKLINVVVT
jgi:leucyl-tRNA synthetase